MMEYKGYTGQITAVDEKQGLFHGRVAGITDHVGRCKPGLRLPRNAASSNVR